MALFSQRKGISPANKALQVESIDQELKNRLWSGLTLHIWNRYNSEYNRVESLIKEIWLHHFKQPIDTVPAFDRGHPSSYKVIRDYFFECNWWQTYDFIEFIIRWAPEAWSEQLKVTLNMFLEDENAAYRIVDNEIVDITDQNEIEAIETALDKSAKTIKIHLSRSLALLSDRKKPDYRNSIKESILAVEAACQLLTGMPKATLGDCIKVIRKSETMHSAFEQALLKLYGYTSDEGGIRHALSEDSNSPSYADAKFMLVASSAFINFLWTKIAELGISLPQ